MDQGGETEMWEGSVILSNVRHGVKRASDRAERTLPLEASC